MHSSKHAPYPRPHSIDALERSPHEARRSGARVCSAAVLAKSTPRDRAARDRAPSPRCPPLAATRRRSPSVLDGVGSTAAEHGPCSSAGDMTLGSATRWFRVVSSTSVHRSTEKKTTQLLVLGSAASLRERSLWPSLRKESRPWQTPASAISELRSERGVPLLRRARRA